MAAGDSGGEPVEKTRAVAVVWHRVGIRPVAFSGGSPLCTGVATCAPEVSEVTPVNGVFRASTGTRDEEAPDAAMSPEYIPRDEELATSSADRRRWEFCVRVRSDAGIIRVPHHTL